jgi:hypothetical protein
MCLTIIFLLIHAEYYKYGLFFEQEPRALIPQRKLHNQYANLIKTTSLPKKIPRGMNYALCRGELQLLPRGTLRI